MILKKKNDLIIGRVKRTAIKWEKVVLHKDVIDYIRCMGHATAKYNSYIYVFGGFKLQYMAKVVRFNIGGYDPQTGNLFGSSL